MYYKLGIEGFQNAQKKQESTFEKGISRAKGIRNSILTGIGGVVTTLVSITPVFHLEPFLIHILGIGGLVSMVTIMILNASSKWIEDLSLSYAEIYEGSIGLLTYSQGFLTTRVARLSEVNYEYVENFFIFTITLSAAIQMDVAKSLKHIAKTHAKFTSYKSVIEDEAKSFQKNSEIISSSHPRINRSMDMPPELLDFVDQVYKNYKAK